MRWRRWCFDPLPSSLNSKPVCVGFLEGYPALGTFAVGFKDGSRGVYLFSYGELRKWGVINRC
jgi:hypothetical protein